MKLVKRIQKEFNNSSDLVIKKLLKVQIIYLESLCSGDKINDYILKIIALKKKNINHILTGPNTVKIEEYDKIEYYLTNGFALILIKNNLYAIEVKADLARSISTPDSQPAIYGPKDAFCENIQTNLGLIKRRIKSAKLVNKDFVIGRKTNTKISLLYLEDIAKIDVVEQVCQKLNKIDIDGIIDAGNINQLISNESSTVFPTIRATERPDYVAANLLEGRIAILVDTSCFVLILPVFLFDFINPQVDNYNKSININFIKLIRLFCFCLTILLPALYIAIINYNPESVSLNLLINFASQRQGVPFPSAIEAIFMLIICELLRESDIRFPSSYGSSISILGALILGESAVSAGIVSPIMIIVTALTFITSLVFSEIEFINSIRHFRFLFLIAASFAGLYGIAIATIVFLIHLASTSSFGADFSYPLAPFDLNYLRKTILQKPKGKDRKRSKMLTDKNFTSQGENK